MTPVPPDPAVPTFWMVASSTVGVAFSRITFWPADRPATLATFTFVEPAGAAAASVVACAATRDTIEVLFSSTALAVPTLPTSQPARVNGTQGAGALRTAPVPPSDGGSALTML